MRVTCSLLAACLMSVLLAACGGGGGSGTGSTGPIGGPAPVPATPAVALPTLNSITLQSDAGDPIGLGQSYRYGAADATISVSARNNKLVVKVEGDEQWTGVFQTGGNATELKVGEYRSLDLYVDNMDASRGGLTWWGNGRSCRTSTGWVVIDSVSYANGALEAIALRFQRNCDGATAALRGEVKYNVNDKTPPTPIGPVPGGLWVPPASFVAGPGNYAYFESEEGDYLGLGRTYRFDDRSARFYIDGGGNDIAINIVGDDVWRAEVRGVASNARLVAGYYPGLRGARFNNPVKGGLSWTIAGRGCSTAAGWFAIDAVEYDSMGDLVLLDMRFEVHCEGRTAALRGMIHYSKLPDLPGSGIVSAAGSWRAPAALLPVSANFLYVESELNESLSHGVTELQTSDNAAIEVSASGNTVEITSKGNRQWRLQFQAPARLVRIVPGVYEGLTWDGGDVASYGALSVGAASTGCFTTKGWVVVDSAIYSGANLVALDLRFEHTCGAYGTTNGVLHGQVRWRAGVQGVYPGPAPVPAGFWRPARTLPTGTYLYATSDRSDFIGMDNTLLTPLDADIIVTEKAGKVNIDIKGDTWWSGSFAAMATAGKILPGYYAGLNEAYRPARGSFTWSGDGRGCNEASAGVVVDHVAYVGDKLSELSLRFEHHCENASGATRAQLQWLASDVRQPPGPLQQMPDSLWRAPVGTLPTTGNFLYIDSGQGDFIGHGRKYLLTPENAAMTFSQNPGGTASRGPAFVLTAKSGNYEAGNFRLDFEAMRSLTLLQPGYYGHLLNYPVHNTAYGGLDLSNNLLGCEKVDGWMVIERVRYEGGKLSAVRGRFEQYCDGNGQPARGEFNWEG